MLFLLRALDADEDHGMNLYGVGQLFTITDSSGHNQRGFAAKSDDVLAQYLLYACDAARYRPTKVITSPLRPGSVQIGKATLDADCKLDEQRVGVCTNKFAGKVTCMVAWIPLYRYYV